MAASTRHRSADGSKAAKREGVPRLASSTPRASITVPVQNSRTAPFGDGPGAVAAVLSHAIWSMSHLNWTNPRACLTSSGPHGGCGLFAVSLDLVQDLRCLM